MAGKGSDRGSERGSDIYGDDEGDRDNDSDDDSNDDSDDDNDDDLSSFKTFLVDKTSFGTRARRCEDWSPTAKPFVDDLLATVAVALRTTLPEP